MKLKTIAFMIGLLMIISACTTALNTNTNTQQGRVITDSGANQAQQPEETTNQEENMDEETKPMEEVVVLAGDTAQYREFNKADYEKSVSEGKTIILNFYANWCPSCKAEEPTIRTVFEGLDREDVVAYRVNYRDGDTDDFEAQLAKDHGITVQGSKVILKNNERVLKAIQHWNNEQWLEKLNEL